MSGSCESATTSGSSSADDEILNLRRRRLCSCPAARLRLVEGTSTTDSSLGRRMFIADNCFIARSFFNLACLLSLSSSSDEKSSSDSGTSLLGTGIAAGGASSWADGDGADAAGGDCGTATSFLDGGSDGGSGCFDGVPGILISLDGPWSLVTNAGDVGDVGGLLRLLTGDVGSLLWFLSGEETAGFDEISLPKR